MAATTKQNTITRLIGTRPYPILASSPYRKAIILSPLAGGSVGGVLLGVQFNPGINQPWIVPPGVTELVDGYCWGGSGKPGIAQGGLGGGGGGGTAFSTTGPQILTPGTTYHSTVAAGAGGSASQIVSNLSVVLAQSNSGADANANLGGAGGVAVAGATMFGGGSGDDSTALGGSSAGGGGAAGVGAAGGNAAGKVPGAGGGTATLLGFGVGGSGGAGVDNGSDGGNGGLPGGGPGGPPSAGGIAGALAPGKVVLFYRSATIDGIISLSHRSDVQPGVGILNYLFGQTFPTTITDDEIGTFIQEEWWIVSSINGVPVQITEYLYDC